MKQLTINNSELRIKSLAYSLKLIAYCLLLVISFTLYPTPLVYASGATLSLSPSSGNLNPGCSFNEQVLLDTGGADTDGTDVIIFYDASHLTANSITNGTLYSDYPSSNIDPQSGKITISGLASVSQAFKGNGVFATINFTVPKTAGAGPTQLKFDFDPNDKTKTTDSNVVERGTVADVLNSVTNANFTIGTGTNCPLGGIGGPGGTGGTSTSSGGLVDTGKKLPSAGGSEYTWLFAGLGGGLTILGLLGLALL